MHRVKYDYSKKVWTKVKLLLMEQSDLGSLFHTTSNMIKSFEKKVKSYTVKPVLSCHLKIEKTKVLMENCSLMKVESIADAMLLTCIKQ